MLKESVRVVLVDPSKEGWAQVQYAVETVGKARHRTLCINASGGVNHGKALGDFEQYCITGKGTERLLYYLTYDCSDNLLGYARVLLSPDRTVALIDTIFPRSIDTVQAVKKAVPCACCLCYDQTEYLDNTSVQRTIPTHANQAVWRQFSGSLIWVKDFTHRLHYGNQQAYEVECEAVLPVR